MRRPSRSVKARLHAAASTQRGSMSEPYNAISFTYLYSTLCNDSFAVVSCPNSFAVSPASGLCSNKTNRSLYERVSSSPHAAIASGRFAASSAAGVFAATTRILPWRLQETAVELDSHRFCLAVAEQLVIGIRAQRQVRRCRGSVGTARPPSARLAAYTRIHMSPHPKIRRRADVSSRLGSDTPPLSILNLRTPHSFGDDSVQTSRSSAYTG